MIASKFFWQSLTVLVSSLITVPMPAVASLADCSSIYVARVMMNTSHGVPWVVFSATPTTLQGSYWQYPSYSLPDRYYEQIYATLLTAQATRAPVAVTTDGPNNCDIMNAPHILTSIQIMIPH